MHTALQSEKNLERVSSEHGSNVSAVAVLVAAALIFFLRLGARALWSSEGRWAEIVREMRLTGRYFWPTINGHLYFDKPLLSYWFIVVTSWFTGTISETTARIPSALAGLLGVALTIVLGRRLYDRATAALAAFVLATSYSYVFFSRHASADVETVTGALAAIALFAANCRRPDGWWLFGLWPVMAITSLTKGLIGFALPLAVIGLYSLLEDGWRGLVLHLTHGPLHGRWRWLHQRLRWLFNLKTPLAAALGLFIYWVPFAISQARNHSEAGLYMVFRENVVRYFAPFDHRGPVYLYVPVIFALMAPWSVLLPAALMQRHHVLADEERRDGLRTDLLALTYFWGTFAFFTLSRSRRSYYLLPILPAAALLVARLLREPTASLWAPARRVMKLAYGLLAVTALAGGIIYLMPPAFRPGRLRLLPPAPRQAAFVILWLIVLAGIGFAVRKLNGARIALSAGLLAYAGMLYLFVFAMPAAERYRTERPFAQAVRARLGDESSHLALYRLWGPGLVYYLAMPRPIAQFTTPAEAEAFARAKGTAWVITRGRDAGSLPGARVIVQEPLMRWDPPSESRNRYVLLELRP
jgi:4-amino-4-deoxy-L-arabinose transferase-like glycosyltransferase